MALRTVGIRLQAEVAGYMAGMRQAKVATGDFVKDLDKAAKAGKLDAVADQAGRMGLGLAAAFGIAVNAAAKFDKQMSEVGAVSDATGADLERLRQAALQAGKDTAFSATEAAKAEAELAKAGMSTSEILNGGLRGALNLAAAGSLDLAEAADISAKALNIFGLEGGDASHVADLLAAAANKSATDVHEMGEAMKQGGLAANSAGMSIEETVGTLAAFADRALVGSDAGTSLKTALIMLQAPTDKAKSLMKELGINAYDASGQFIGTAELAGELQQALGGMTQEQRNAALATIFGADAMRAANVLFEVGEQGIRDYTAAVDDQGAAAEVAAKKMDNLAGDLERLKGSLETLAIESASGATSGLRTLVKTADNLVASVSNIPGPVQTAGVVIAGVAGAMLLTAAGAIKMKKATADARSELANLGPTGARVSTALDRAGRAATRVGVALAAVQVASAALGSSASATGPEVELLGTQLSEFARSGEVGSAMARLFGDDLGKLDSALKGVADTGVWTDIGNGIAGFIEGTTGLGNVMDDSLQHAKERLNSLDQTLTQMVQSGQGQQAAAIFKAIADRAAEQGVSVNELNKVLPGYAAAAELAGKAGGEAGKGGQDAATGIDAVGEAAAEAEKKVQDLKDAFDRLFGVQMSIDRANIAYREGLRELGAAVREAKEDHDKYAVSLATNTAKGDENRGMVLDQIEAIKNLRDANISNGMSIAAADAAYDSQLVSLGKTLVSLGFNESAVWALINGYRNVPKKAGTEVSAPGAVKSKKQADDVAAAVRNIPPGKKVPIDAQTARAEARVNSLQDKIDAMHGTTVTVTVLEQRRIDSRTGGNRQQRWGGITEHAQSGLLREAQIASPMGPARISWAEPATGGEAFIPKFGDLDRSRDIWGYVGANWLGMRPTRSSSADPNTARPAVNVTNHFTINAAPNQSVRAIAEEVSRIQGRQANVYAR